MYRCLTKTLVLCMLFLLAVPLASSYMDPYTDPTENQNIIIFMLDPQKQITEFKVVRDNPFYRLSDKYGSVFDIADELPENLGEKAFSMKLFNSYDEIIYEAEYYANFYIPYFGDIKRIEVYDDQNNIVFSREMSFCNYNSVCESCEGAGCSTMENSATCADCASGGSDNYCDLNKDGICDPDCSNLDRDCAGCSDNECYYTDSMDISSICGDYEGEVCATIDECAGEIAGYDENGFCCIGDCIDPTVDEEYLAAEPVEIEFTGASDDQGQYEDIITDPVELFNMNYNGSIPVEDESGKILCSNVGKSICGIFEKCVNGDYVHSDDEGDECCTGECVPLSDDEFNEAYKQEFNEDYKKAEEIKPIAAPAEEEVVSAVGALQISPLWFLLTIIPLVIIIFLYNTERKKGEEKRKRIDYEYNYYKNYGYNDEQIRSILAQRGWKKEDIKKMMKK